MRKPKILISKCLNSHKCRYDGQGFDNKFIQNIKPYVDIEEICPEVEIGLSTPREPIRIEKHGEDHKLVESKSKIDYTNNMVEFANEFMCTIDDIDGFIMKSKSPSCGVKDVKVYNKDSKCSLNKKGIGLFANELSNKYSNYLIEDDGRLKNYNIRDEFLTNIFMINRFKNSDNTLDFHKENEMLLKSYSNELYDKLTTIVAEENMDKEKYLKEMMENIKKPRKYKNKLQVINSVFNTYKDKLNENEVSLFNDLICSYENQKIPFSSLETSIKIYAKRFNDENTFNQTFFNPYPNELMSMDDSGKGKRL